LIEVKMTQPQQPFKRGRNVFTRTLFHPVTYYFIQAAGFIGIGYTMLIHTKWGEGTVLYDVSNFELEFINSNHSFNDGWKERGITYSP